jgi:acetyl-CoA carboxylase biotin carboxyl carrier protein
MSAISFDPDQVRQLAAILAETSLTEIEIVEGENSIRVARAPAQVTTFAGGAAPAPAIAAAPSTAESPAAPVSANDFGSHPGLIKSPMVGVAYLSAEPGAAPFVTAGATVAAGQTVLLIEAMKTFNQIKAPKAGVVLRILVTAGAPVEYGEPLMVIE